MHEVSVIKPSDLSQPMKTRTAFFLISAQMAAIYAGKDEQQPGILAKMVRFVESLSCDISALNCVDSDETTTQPGSNFRNQQTEEQRNELQLRSDYESQISFNTYKVPDEKLIQICERYMELCEKYIEVDPCAENSIFAATGLMAQWEDANLGFFDL